MARERDAALKRVQELLTEGQVLTAQHQELKCNWLLQRLNMRLACG